NAYSWTSIRVIRGSAIVPSRPTVCYNVTHAPAHLRGVSPMSILTRRVQVLFSPDQIARLQAIAQAKGESVGALIRQAVETVYFHPQPERRREAVKRMAAL